MNHKKVFGIMTHDGSMDGNVGVMVEYLKERGEGYTFQFIKKADRKMVKNFNIMKGKVSFFIVKPYHLATSRYVLLDNVFLPMAYLKFPKKVRVIQLWHGTGTIKRFGQDVNTGRLKSLEGRANSRITHLIVNSEETKKEYMSSFGIGEDKVFVYGSPRTDLFFNAEKINLRKQKFYDQYPDLAGKKLVLYAPTFRDQEKDNPKLALDIESLSRGLPKDYSYLLRLHPHVCEAYLRAGHTYQEENVISMSSYSDINTLLLVADYLITDYSSVIFEYCLREKPMIFFAYDLEEFSDHGRGFYNPYETYVPGPIAHNTGAIIDMLKTDQFDLDRVKTFVKTNYQYLDGKSAERIYLHIFRE
jgi:CDP-ribitol ribitolphosphotransferase